MADFPPRLQFISISLRIKASGKKKIWVQYYLPDIKENIWKVNSRHCSCTDWAKAEILFAKHLFTLIWYEPKPGTTLTVCKSPRLTQWRKNILLFNWSSSSMKMLRWVLNPDTDRANVASYYLLFAGVSEIVSCIEINITYLVSKLLSMVHSKWFISDVWSADVCL